MYLVVDGMLSGTGIRDAITGGYLETNSIGLSAPLQRRIVSWLSAYADAHYHNHADRKKNEALDTEGIEIARLIKAELPSAKVTYFSSAHLRPLPV